MLTRYLRDGNVVGLPIGLRLEYAAVFRHILDGVTVPPHHQGRVQRHGEYHLRQQPTRTASTVRRIVHRTIRGRRPRASTSFEQGRRPRAPTPNY
eukprot:1187210-Prorocentrum_minimum.AAC.2